MQNAMSLWFCSYFLKPAKRRKSNLSCLDCLYLVYLVCFPGFLVGPTRGRQSLINVRTFSSRTIYIQYISNPSIKYRIVFKFFIEQIFRLNYQNRTLNRSVVAVTNRTNWYHVTIIYKTAFGFLVLFKFNPNNPF